MIIPKMSLPATPPQTTISVDDYMEQYADQYYEWVKGALVPMAPVGLNHDQITAYLRHCFEIYFSLKPLGIVVGQPFVMKLAESRREPDLQVILHPNTENLQPTLMDGPADICVEVVSAANEDHDYGVKFIEYEKNGVREYWLIDPLRAIAHFYRRSDDTGLYTLIPPDQNLDYTSPLLPRLRLHIPTLWTTPLPDIIQTVQVIQNMLKE